jgi:predicted nucleic acid-binding protein
LVTCPDIVLEYQDVFHRPKFHRFGFPPLWLNNLLKLAHHHTENPDPNDLVFLSLAHRMEATLVTSNLKHYPIEMRRGVIVLNAREFLEQYQQRNTG